MPKELNQEVLTRLAKLGALARLEQIDVERRSILAAFPDLAARTARRRAPVARQTSAQTTAAPKRRKRHMTAAQRQAVAERMKKYWADRRKEKAE